MSAVSIYTEKFFIGLGPGGDVINKFKSSLATLS